MGLNKEHVTAQKLQSTDKSLDIKQRMRVGRDGLTVSDQRDLIYSDTLHRTEWDGEPGNWSNTAPHSADWTR